MNYSFVFNIRKRIVFILIVVVLLVGSSIAFAFWDQTQVVFDDNQINLGEGAFLEVSKTVNPTQTLVPYGSFKGANDIDEYTYSYIVTFNKEGRLRVLIDEESILIGDGDHAFNDLVHIQVYIEDVPLNQEKYLEITTDFIHYNEIDEVYYVEVFVRVFVLGPSDSSHYLSAYQTLMRNVITFSVQFNALEIE